MTEQAEGVLGRAVDGMIRRSVRRAFHGVRWIPPAAPLPEPCVLVPNHHGWHDGYVMYVAATRLGLRFVDWIQEFDAFPLFAKVGGMPFPADDASRRAATIRQTIRLMRQEKRNLLLFAEGVLHRPPELMEFGRSLELVAEKTGAATIPVAIRYEAGLHERPECFLQFGGPVEPGPNLAARTRLEVRALLDLSAVKIRHEPEAFSLLAAGTPDVNERWDMRRIPGRKYHRRS